MRVMTYNLKGLHLSAHAAAAVVRDAAPDVLAVQEPPRGLRGRRRMRRFAAAVGLVAVVNGRGARTTALLVRPGLAVDGARAVRLSWRPGRTRRGVSTASVDGVTFVSVHLSLVRVERAAHLERLLDEVVPQTRAIVLGDLNEQPNGPAWARLADHLAAIAVDTGPTFPAIAPRQRIDAVLATPDLNVVGAQVPDGPAVERGSDHRPIVVDLA